MEKVVFYIFIPTILYIIVIIYSMDRTQLLLELREYGRINEVPNITDVNAHFLCDLLKISGAKNMLEIGTANGYSAICFGDILEQQSGKLTSIEFSELSHNLAHENIARAQLEQTTQLILGNALDEIPKLPDNSFDFIFIDGMKRRSKDFLELCLPKCQTGGIIILDDVIKFKDKMVGLDEYLEKNNLRYNILPIDEDDGVMMMIKK